MQYLTHCMGRVGGLLMLVREVHIVTAVVAARAQSGWFANASAGGAYSYRSSSSEGRTTSDMQTDRPTEHDDSNGRQANSHSTDDLVVFLSRATQMPWPCLETGHDRRPLPHPFKVNKFDQIHNI